MTEEPTADAAPEEGPTVQIANEFTTVRVRKVWTRNGERLEVRSAKLGTSILLDPLELESLTWQTPDTFSRMLEHPYGPDDIHPRALSELITDSADVRFNEERGDGGTG